MLTYRYGGKNGQSHELTVSDEHVVVRTKSRGELDLLQLSRSARAAVKPLTRMFRLAEVGIELHRITGEKDARKARDRARSALKGEEEVEFAGRALWDSQTGEPVLYTENLFLQFFPDIAPSRCQEVLDYHGIHVKREIPYLRNAFFANPKTSVGHEIFTVADRLLSEESVELCHPELVKRRYHRVAFPQQWHLAPTEVGGVPIDAHAHVAAAWDLSEGAGVVIAVIDDGFDLSHEELRSPDKIVHPRDATRRNDDPRPGPDDNHGTPCAGVACGEGLHGASGVAPKAHLMPIRLASMLGSQDEADALVWAADHGADVISCSWGPHDGNPLDASDPAHNAEHFLPDSTRRALEYVTENGRDGRGCVVTWAAGNGNESVDLDHYASYERVITVAACSDQNERSLYSDFGEAIWCAFPSNDFFDVDPRTGRAHRPQTLGIWAPDRNGPAGYNPGVNRLGDRQGKYYNRFGGTSSACPGVAGVVALMLAVNPDLRWQEVRDLLRETAEPIDPENGEYDDEGHSLLYGYGRVDAAAAVREAQARVSSKKLLAQRPGIVTVTVETEAPDLLVRIDEQPLEIEEGRCQAALAMDQSYILSWWLRGEPGTPYRIHLEAEGLEVVGRLPIESGIAKNSTKAAGTRIFELRRK
jgi:subtilisin family serine protease